MSRRRLINSDRLRGFLAGAGAGRAELTAALDAYDDFAANAAAGDGAASVSPELTVELARVLLDELAIRCRAHLRSLGATAMVGHRRAAADLLLELVHELNRLGRLRRRAIDGAGDGDGDPDDGDDSAVAAAPAAPTLAT